MQELKQLTPQDVMFIAGESDRIYQHTAGLVLLDPEERPGFGFDSFRDYMVERIGKIPHFHWRLHEVPLGLDLPYWVEDEQFSFDRHIRRIAVPSPGDRAALSELVGFLYSKHLDRSRPLWELWFIEGLEDGRYAIFQKLHHCMMDGQAAQRLGEIMGDFEPNAAPKEPEPAIRDARPGAVPSAWQQSGNTLTHLSRLPFQLGRDITALLRPRIRQALSGGKKPSQKKPTAPPTCFNADIGVERGFVFGSVPLEDVKRVKEHFDCTVNDVVMALVGSTLRDYLLARGELPEISLRASMAVSTRSKDDGELGNKVTSASVTLGTDLADPAARLRAINAETGAAARERRGGGRGPMEIIQGFPPLVVSALFNLMPADQVVNVMGANVVVSNVRGSTRPMYMAGARMVTTYPMSIISPGAGINVTCLSYAGNIDFGFTVDPLLVPDPWKLIEGLESALRQYLTLPGKRGRGGSPGNKRKKKTAKAARKGSPARRKTATSGKARAGSRKAGRS